jgi:mRNA-degrading endonuclease RelE of RelBE toxin-antitoxin system
MSDDYGSGLELSQSGVRSGGVISSAPMFQIIFNEISAAEMAALPKELQLELLAQFEVLHEDLEQPDDEKYGVIERDGKKLHRYRARDYRIYFAQSSEGIIVHRVLHRNTLRDFLFRAKLPMPAEDEQLGQQRGFWELIEEGEKTGRRR